MKQHNPLLISTVLVFYGFTGCNHCSDNATSNRDPTRCEVRDAGDAMALIEKGDIDSNRMIRTEGMADPRALVWQDKRTKEVYYITRLMGTQQRLFFRKHLKSEEKPTILTEFEGHVLRWDELPDDQAAPIAKALADQYNIHIVPHETYLINADTRPQGCP